MCCAPLAALRDARVYGLARGAATQGAAVFIHKPPWIYSWSLNYDGFKLFTTNKKKHTFHFPSVEGLSLSARENALCLVREQRESSR